MSTSKAAIRFSTWVPPDAQKEFDDLYSILTLREARYMLQRLATRPTMEGAWAELKHFKNVTPDILVTSTFMAWISTMRVEKGRGYASPPLGTDPAPNSSPLPHELAPHARAVANYLRAVDPTIRAENGITETTLKELDGVWHSSNEKLDTFTSGLVSRRYHEKLGRITLIMSHSSIACAIGCRSRRDGVPIRWSPSSSMSRSMWRRVRNGTRTG